MRVVADVARPQVRIVIPFINTHPHTDICLTLVLLPLWWVLGAEQFAPIILVFLAGFKVLLIRERVWFPPILIWLSLYVLAQLVSSLFIVEPFRYISFARTFLLHLMAFVTVFVLANTLTSKRTVHRTLAALVACLALTSVAGLAGIIGVVRPEFNSLVGDFLPSALASTDYGQQILNRQIGAQSWFAGLGQFFRVDGFFLFSTTYAAALALALPLAFWLTTVSVGTRRVMFGLATALIGINLIFTTGRGAILSLIVAAIYPLIAGRRLPGKATLIGIGIVSLAVAAILVPSGAISESVSTTVYARGEGSAVSRLTIYTQTLKGFLDRPIFGWGTERDITTLEIVYPAGSHSDVLSALYKYGLIGFTLYICLWVSIWIGSRPRLGNLRSHRSLPTHLRWSLLASMAISLITVLSLDTMLMLIFWVVVGVTVSLQRLTPQDPNGPLMGTM